MIDVTKIDHVAICVDDLDAALERFAKLLGVRASSREVVASQQTEAALLPIGESNIELIAPRGNAGLEKFLAKRGPGIHHVCVRVKDLAQTLVRLKAAGVPLIDEVPRPGARGHKVAFVHPKALGGVLLELEEP
jgi:methylmalonyl-CoA/ethylmalonyl-CoA epimerase